MSRLLETPHFLPRPTTFRMTTDDEERLEQLRGELGIRSTTEVVRYALKVATSPRGGARGSSADALKALALWEPVDFEGTRAKALVEEFLRSG